MAALKNAETNRMFQYFNNNCNKISEQQKKDTLSYLFGCKEGDELMQLFY